MAIMISCLAGVLTLKCQVRQARQSLTEVRRAHGLVLVPLVVLTFATFIHASITNQDSRLSKTSLNPPSCGRVV